MTLFAAIGESKPQVRPTDLLTLDHPLRAYDTPGRVRNSAWLRAGVFIAVVVGSLILVISIVAAVTGDVRPMMSGWLPGALELISAVIAYLVLVLVMEQRGRPIEISPTRLLGLVKGIAVGIVLMGMCVGILALLGVYRVESVNWSVNPWPTIVSAGLVAGIAEEVLFRGILFRLTEEGLGTWGAAVASSLVFGLAHLSNPDATVWGAIAIAIEAGILFAAVYTLTRSLWWCIGVHFAWNVTQGVVFGSVISGSGTPDSWLVASWSGPDLLSGGDFGIEASLVTVVALGVLGLAGLVFASRQAITVAPIWARKRALLSHGQEAQAPDPAN